MASKKNTVVRRRAMSEASVRMLEVKSNLLFERGINLDTRTFTLGDIDEGLFEYTSSCLSILEQQGNGNITIELSSFGGSTYEALAIIGRIQASPCKVNITVYGKCMSAATLILAAATGKRKMAKTSWFMYHEARYELGDQRHSNQRDILEQYEKEERAWDRWMGVYTKKPEAFWTELSNSRKDHYFSPEECLEMGVIDMIV